MKWIGQWSLVLPLLGLACGPVEKSVEQPQPPPPDAAPPSEAPQSDALHQLMEKLERPEPVLAVLEAGLRQQLDETLDRLSLEQKRALTGGGDAVVYVRPLLHLAAGGEDLGAYTALFASSAAADELVYLRQTSGQLEDLVPLVSELAERAAWHVLRERIVDVQPGQQRRPEILGHIVAAAEFVGRDDIALAAIDALNEVAPSPEVQLMRASLLAKQLQWQAAEAALPDQETVSPRDWAEVRQLIAAARVCAESPSETLSQQIDEARAALLLSRHELAEQALAEVQAPSAQHLALATTRARVAAGEGSCPKLKGAIGNAHLCRSAWQRFRSTYDWPSLEQAWLSELGRDVEAVETYLGLTHAVPLMFGLMEDDQLPDADAYTAQLQQVQAKARQASSLSPHFDAVASFAGTLQVALGSVAGDEAGSLSAIAPKQRQQLMNEVSTLFQRAPDGRWPQAAALSVLAVLAQFEDGTALLQGMAPHVHSEHHSTFGNALLWNLLANGDVQGLREADAVFTKIAQAADPRSFERSRWLLAWAEGAAHLRDEQAQQDPSLIALCDKLSSERVALDLRLRCAISQAGWLARQQRWSEAGGKLAPVVDATPRGSVASRTEQELLVAATGYRMVLEFLASSDVEQQSEKQGHLQDLIEQVVRAAAAPPILQTWLRLWDGELRAGVETQRCRGNRACQNRAAKLRGMDKRKLEAAVGPRAAAMLHNGVLPVGGVEIELRYAQGRLHPHVAIDPAYLLVHMPTL